MRAMVESKLIPILERLEGHRAIGKHPAFFSYQVYRYGHEAALLLAGLGLSHPVLLRLFGLPDAGEVGQEQAVGFLGTLAELGPVWYVLAVLCLVFWLVIRIYVSVERLEEKGPLMASCRSELADLEAPLKTALESERPLDGLNKVRREAGKVIERYRRAQAWPWPVGPDGDNVGKSVRKRVTDLCDRYEAGWAAAPVDDDVPFDQEEE